jgi:hypothetical protein
MTIVPLKVGSFFSHFLLRSSLVESTSSPLQHFLDRNGGRVVAALQRQQDKAAGAGHEADVGRPCTGAEVAGELDPDRAASTSAGELRPGCRGQA